MPSTIGLGRMLFGIIVLFVVMVMTVVVFPAVESGQADPSLRAITYGNLDAFAASPSSPQAADALAELGVAAVDVHDGWVLYRNEGCVQCHTQQVRAIVTDVGLGPVVGAADIALTPFDLTGHQRLGPDLSSVGTRLGSDELETVITDASQRHGWTTMPAYDYLTADEISDLVSYLSTLR